jgi:hypothetical protein
VITVPRPPRTTTGSSAPEASADEFLGIPRETLRAILDRAVVELPQAHADWIATLSGTERLAAKELWIAVMEPFEADAAAVVDRRVAAGDRRRGSRR